MIAIFTYPSIGYPSGHAVTSLAYKKNINDPRESPANNIIKELVNIGADMQVYETVVPSLATKAGVFSSAGSVEEALSCAVCAIFPVDHNVFRGISTRWWRS